MSIPDGGAAHGRIHPGGLQEVQDGAREKVHGWFLFGKPALSMNDVEILIQKQIQVNVFNYFVEKQCITLRGKLVEWESLIPINFSFHFQLWGLGNPNDKCRGHPVLMFLRFMP